MPPDQSAGWRVCNYLLGSELSFELDRGDLESDTGRIVEKLNARQERKCGENEQLQSLRVDRAVDYLNGGVVEIFDDRGGDLGVIQLWRLKRTWVPLGKIRS